MKEESKRVFTKLVLSGEGGTKRNTASNFQKGEKTAGGCGGGVWCLWLSSLKSSGGLSKPMGEQKRRCNGGRGLPLEMAAPSERLNKTRGRYTNGARYFGPCEPGGKGGKGHMGEQVSRGTNSVR